MLIPETAFGTEVLSAVDNVSVSAETVQDKVPAEMKKGTIYVIGSGLIATSGLLKNAKPFKTEGEIDWEQRKTATEKYENLGICQCNNYVNVRKKASTEGDIIGKMTNNNACDILETSSDGKWYKIESGSVTGWVTAEYILTGWQAEDKGREVAELQITINTDTLNVRMEPDVNSKIWTQANTGEHYDVANVLDNWVEIELDDETGFVAKEYVSVGYRLNTAKKYVPTYEDANQPIGSRIVAYAMKWLGGKYVWGGETLGKGVDCSGFTKCVYAKFGYYLIHYSGDQAREGKKIRRNQLQKGDLVFYAKNGTINHVAIYIGDGQVIHARSTKRGICITDMYYRTPVKYVTYIHK